MSLAHYICVTGTGEYRSFQDGYHLICSVIHQEKYQYLFLCAKASNDFESFMNSKKKEELDKIIAEENLNKEETYNFIQRSFEQGRVETNGTEVSTILPPMSMFTPNNDRQEKKNKVIDKLLEFFDKFFSISNNKF